jgi:hypothetical protein
MVPNPNSVQMVGTGSRQSTVVGTESRQVRFGIGYEYKVHLVPDSDSGNLAHKYRIAELVQEGWNYLEVKGYTWKIEA